MKSQFIFVSVLAALAFGQDARNILQATSADDSKSAPGDSSVLPEYNGPKNWETDMYIANEIDIPNLSTPEPPITESTTPESATPKSATPESATPEIKNPDNGTSDLTTSKLDTPESSAPKSIIISDSSSNKDKDIWAEGKKDKPSSIIDFESSSHSTAAFYGSERHIFSLAAGLGMAVWLTL